MKKLVTVFSALLLVGCIAVIFYGCGAKDKEADTTTPSTTRSETITTTEKSAMDEGKVTDESEKGDNGVIGDVVTDVSEGVSDAVTEMSEDVSDVME